MARSRGPAATLEVSVFDSDGDPNGVVAATMAGDLCVDSTNRTLYSATSSGTVWEEVTSLTLNNQTGTTYDLVLSDAQKLVTVTNAGAITVTIPANASIAFVVGTRIEIIQLGAGQITVAITTDTLHSAIGLKTRAQYSKIELTKVTATHWIVSGDLVA